MLKYIVILLMVIIGLGITYILMSDNPEDYYKYPKLCMTIIYTCLPIMWIFLIIIAIALVRN